MCQRFTGVSRSRAAVRMVASSLWVLACLVGFVVFTHSQVAGSRKFQEFGNVSEEDEMAHLDAFASELQKDPQLRGFIIAYDNPDSKLGWFFRQTYGYRSYLVNKRGIAPDRITVIDGGNRPQFVIELWLAPPGAALPSATAGTQLDSSLPTRFDEVPLNASCWFGFTMQLAEPRDALQFFAQALRNNPSLKALILVHPKKHEPISKAAQTLTTSRTLLKKDHGIAEDRVITKLATRRPVCADLALWLLPTNVVVPVNENIDVFLQSLLLNEAERNQFTVRRVEFVGNMYTRDMVLRRRIPLLQEGNVFTKEALQRSLRSVSQLKIIEPVRLRDIEARLDRQNTFIDLTISFTETPSARRHRSFR